MALVDPETLQRELRKLQGWERGEREIAKAYRFKDFKEAIAFVNEVAHLAEARNHHPDILIQYNRVTLKLSTHDEGGVTEKDLAMASACDALL
ncbi:MAG: 4a-hydroxytetrahydrobiopterin dehydratase [Chloroflexi bacterium]|nr:4a-hydroxytetrahydrobiopterin dehydratase [Chloroflexota bacterium]